MKKKEQGYNLLSTIVKGYNISTGYIQSSLDGSGYYETIVCEYKNSERGNMLYKDFAGYEENDAIQNHIRKVLDCMKFRPKD